MTRPSRKAVLTIIIIAVVLGFSGFILMNNTSESTTQISDNSQANISSSFSSKVRSFFGGEGTTYNREAVTQTSCINKARDALTACLRRPNSSAAACFSIFGRDINVCPAGGPNDEQLYGHCMDVANQEVANATPPGGQPPANADQIRGIVFAQCIAEHTPRQGVKDGKKNSESSVFDQV
jgi:hypothetical protein